MSAPTSTDVSLNLDYIILAVENVSQTVVFYQTALGVGCHHMSDDGAYAILTTGDARLALVQRDGLETLLNQPVMSFSEMAPEGSPPRLSPTAISFKAEDVDHTYAQALGAGASSVTSPQNMPWGLRAAFIQDCNGLLIEVCGPVTD